MQINKILPDPLKYDPWEFQQQIANFKVTVHCCRYWMLSEWECENMAFPFWRLYHSRLGNSYVTFHDQNFHLEAGKMVLIPPFTSFSTRLHNSSTLLHGESIKGIRIQNVTQIAELAKSGLTDQLFVHFNLGYPYDNVHAGIYEIPVTDEWLEKIRQIETQRLTEPNVIDFRSNLRIVELILYALQNLSSMFRFIPEVDSRIQGVVRYIDANLDQSLTNEKLSMMANMAVNSFARLFKGNMKISVQKFIQKRRIDSAIILLHHSDLSIEEIAVRCGFFDRRHFSRVFKTLIAISPGLYRHQIRKI